MITGQIVGTSIWAVDKSQTVKTSVMRCQTTLHWRHCITHLSVRRSPRNDALVSGASSFIRCCDHGVPTLRWCGDFPSFRGGCPLFSCYLGIFLLFRTYLPPRDKISSPKSFLDWNWKLKRSNSFLKVTWSLYWVLNLPRELFSSFKSSYFICKKLEEKW